MYVAGEIVVEAEGRQLLPPLVLLVHQRLGQLLVLLGAPHLLTHEHVTWGGEMRRNEMTAEPPWIRNVH